jgi:hypothetical protein
LDYRFLFYVKKITKGEKSISFSSKLEQIAFHPTKGTFKESAPVIPALKAKTAAISSAENYILVPFVFAKVCQTRQENTPVGCQEFFPTV